MASRANHLHQGVYLTGSRGGGGGGVGKLGVFPWDPEKLLFFMSGLVGLPVMNLSKFRS